MASCPADTVAVVEAPDAAAIEKSTALPDRETICGEFAALSATVNVPFELPTALGLKVTLIVHVFDGPSDEPQLFVWAKPPFAPGLAAATMLVKFKGMFPLLASETLCDPLVAPTRSVPNASVD